MCTVLQYNNNSNCPTKFNNCPSNCIVGLVSQELSILFSLIKLQNYGHSIAHFAHSIAIQYVFLRPCQSISILWQANYRKTTAKGAHCLSAP